MLFSELSNVHVLFPSIPLQYTVEWLDSIPLAMCTAVECLKYMVHCRRPPSISSQFFVFTKKGKKVLSLLNIEWAPYKALNSKSLFSVAVIPGILDFLVF